MPSPQEIRQTITEALGKNDLDVALDLLEQYDGTLLNYRYTVKITTLRSRLNETTIERDTLTYEEYNRQRAVMIAGAMEVMNGLINGIAAPQTGVDTREDRELTADQARRVLSVFIDKKDKLHRASTEEMTELANLGGRLYDLIFQDLNDRIAANPELAATRVSVSFTNIITARELGEAEKIFLQNIRHGEGFTPNDRVLVVSALSLSATAAFDLAKVHLLCDFVSDGEPEVWDRALVGLVLCLLRYDNKVPFFPEVISRLELFRGNPEVQQGIYHIQNILASGSFSPKQQLLNLGIDGLMGIIGSIVDFNEIFPAEALEEIKEMSRVEILFNLPALEAQMSEKGELTFGEIFGNLHLEQILEVYDSGVFGFDLATHPILSTPQNWFVPFGPDAQLVRRIVMEADGPSIDYKRLVAALDVIPGMTDIDKFQLLLLAPTIDSEILEAVMESENLVEHLKAVNPRIRQGMDQAAQRIAMILRNMDRFIRLFPKERLSTLLEANYNLNSTNLLEAIGEAKSKLILNGNLLFEQGNYAGSLSCFQQALREDPDDLLLLVSGRNCAYRLKEWALAETYYLRELELHRNSSPTNVEETIEALEGLLSVRMKLEDADKLIDSMLNYHEIMDGYLKAMIRRYNESEEEQLFMLLCQTAHRFAGKLNVYGVWLIDKKKTTEALYAFFSALGTYASLGDYPYEESYEIHRTVWRNVAATLSRDDYAFVDLLERENVLPGLKFDHLIAFFTDLIPALQLGVLIYVRRERVGELLKDIAGGADLTSPLVSTALEKSLGPDFREQQKEDRLRMILANLLGQRLQELAAHLFEHDTRQFHFHDGADFSGSVPWALIQNQDTGKVVAYLMRIFGDRIRRPVIDRIQLYLKTVEQGVPEVEKTVEKLPPVGVTADWVTAKALEMILSASPVLGGAAGAQEGDQEGNEGG